MRIVIFAKAPQPGIAKTRLIPALGASGAAALARRMLAHTLTCALQSNCGSIELCVTPPFADDTWRDVDLPEGVAISDQGNGDLGARMARCARRVLPHESALLIGTDCIELDDDRLRSAARALASYDTVMHPTVDGGYALLGLRRYDDRLFSDIAWSTSAVARTTLDRIAELGWSVQRAATLRDIDGPTDLIHVPHATFGQGLPI